MLNDTDLVEEQMTMLLEKDSKIKEVVQKLIYKELDSLQASTLIASRLSYLYSFNPIPNVPYTELLVNRIVVYFVMGVQEVIIENQDQKSKQMFIVINFLLAMLLLSFIVLF